MASAGLSVRVPGIGEAVPLPATAGVCDLDEASVLDVESRWEANSDKVVGEGTGLATSIDCGRGRASGIAKVLARAERDGNGDDETAAEASTGFGLATGVAGDSVLCASFSGSGGGVMCCGDFGDGVLGGRRLPSEAPHASLAAVSSTLSSGSNSLRMSFETAFGTCETDESDTNPPKIDWP